MTEKTLTFPTIHMNGTSAVYLKEALENAYSSIGDAQKALRQTTPNARDYYVQSDPEAYKKAADQHYARLQALENIRTELVDICNAIDSQIPPRRQP